MKNKRSMFVFLLLFHIIISITLFSAANTEYFSSLHNGEGLWNFARDSTLYHEEALNLVTYIEKSAWFDWWYLYPDHQHIKLISLVYWITGYHSPIAFEIVNSVVWATSLFLIYRVSELLFPGDIKLPLIVSIFFLQPSVLASSTQLLRDPFFILGFSFMCYGFSIFAKQNSKWKWVFMIQIGIILMLLMRDYMSLILLAFLSLFSVIVYSKNKSFITPLLALLIPLILYEFITVNRFISPDTMQMERNNYQKQIQASLSIDEQPQVSVAIDEQPQETLSIREKSKARTIAIQEKIKSDTIAIQEKIKSDTIAIQEKIKSDTIAIQKEAQARTIAISFQTQADIINQVTILEILDTISRRINTMRHGFIIDTPEAGSFIDKDKRYNNFFELALHFPRAMQVGFLSPFPSDWLKKSVEVEAIGKLLASMEMTIWYILLLGFIYIMYKNPSVIKPLASVLLLSIALIILLGYIVPNVGAIYRMRQAYMIPFFLFGAHGLRLMISNLNIKQLT